MIGGRTKSQRMLDAYRKSKESDKNVWMTRFHMIIFFFVQKITGVLYRVISVFSKVTNVLCCIRW